MKKKQGKSTQRKNGQNKLVKLNSNLHMVTARTHCHAPGCIAPDSMRVTLRYAQNNFFTLVANVGQSLQYNGNSVFDPYRSGVGLDAQGFTQWAGLYTRYRVLASRFRVLAVVAPQAANGPIQFCTTAYPGTTAISPLVSLDDAASSTFGKSKWCMAYSLPQTLDTSLTTATVYGVIPTAVNTDDRFSAVTTANPSDVWCWQLSALAAVAQVIEFQIQMFYDVVFFDRLQTTA